MPAPKSLYEVPPVLQSTAGHAPPSLYTDQPESLTAGRWNGPDDLAKQAQVANQVTGHEEGKGPSYWDGIAMLGEMYSGGVPSALGKFSDLMAKNPEHPVQQSLAIGGQTGMAALSLLPGAKAPAMLAKTALGRTAFSAGAAGLMGAPVGALEHLDDPLSGALHEAGNWALGGGLIHGAFEAPGVIKDVVQGAVRKLAPWAFEPRGTAKIPAFAGAPERTVSVLDPELQKTIAARTMLNKAAVRARLVTSDGVLDTKTLNEVRALLPEPTTVPLSEAGPQELTDLSRAVQYMTDKKVPTSRPITGTGANKAWEGTAGDITRYEAEAASALLGPSTAGAGKGLPQYMRMVGSGISSFKRWADQFGNAGKFFSDKINSAQERAIIHAAPWITKLKEPLDALSPAELDRFTDVIEGNDVLPEGGNTALHTAVDAWHSIQQEVAQKAKDIGMMVRGKDGEWKPFQPRDFYFPRMWTKQSLAKMDSFDKADLFAEANKMRPKDGPAITDDNSFLEAMYKARGNLLNEKGQWRLADVVSSNLQRQRWTDLQGYERDPKIALPVYLLKAGQALSATEHFGQRQELLEGMLQTIQKNQGKGQDLNHFVDLARKTIGGWSDPTWNDLYNVTSSVEIGTRLGLGATLKHFPGQIWNTIIQGGGQEALGAMGKMTGKDPAFTKLVNETGVSLRQLINNLIPEMAHEAQELPGSKFARGMKTWSNGWTKAIGLQHFVQIQRFHAAATGILEAKKFTADLMSELGKTNGSAARVKTLAGWLHELNLDPAEIIRSGGKLTDEQLRTAGLHKAFDTQLMGRFGDLPPLAHNQIGRFLYLFKSAAFQQGVVNKEQVWKPFLVWVDSGGLKGTPKPMVKWLARAGTDKFAAGHAIAYIKAFGSGKEVDEEEKNHMLEAITAANSAGMLGWWADLLESIDRPRADSNSLLGNLAGPIISDAVDLGFSAGESVAKLSPKPIAGWAVGHVPIIGRRLRRGLKDGS